MSQTALVGTSDDGTDSSSAWSAERVRVGLAAIALATLPFLSAPGNIVPDTKLDLVIDPAGFLARALHAWDGQAAFGQLQNQAYGYLWPMGPFFLAGKGFGVPDWALQRLWWSLLLVVAFAGVLVLGRALRLASGWPLLLAALGYALAPRIESALSTVSIEAWPMAVLPWTVIPLVAAMRGSLGVRRAAALSALAVACMGGVNAAAVIATLAFPALFLVVVVRRWRLLAWWLPSVLLATAWWWIPLLVLGKFAYPFLDYIESAAVTTSVTSGINDLRGTDQWLAFVIGSVGPVWPAGLWLAAAVAGILCTAIAAGLGLAGLVAAPAGRIRSWLATSILVGVCVLMIGYAGAGGSLVAMGFQQLLDGPLAPFRNIHKFDPLIRLPLALGLALALAELDRRWRVSRARDWPRSGSAQRRQVTAAVAVGCAVTAVVGVMLPALRGDLAAPLSFEKVPPAQAQAASAMSEVPGRTLLVPGSAFGEYVWGRPLDEPMQALAKSPWAIRNAIPLGAPGATRWLDGIQGLLSSGVGQRELARVLRSAGISQVLLRNDLLPASRTLPGSVARATLIASPGLRRSAGFGAPVAASSGIAALPIGGGKQARALEIFSVEQESPVARHVPMTAVRRYVGGPEAATSNLGLGFAPVAQPDAPETLAPGGTIITDTLRRRALNFGAQVGHDYGPTVPAWQDVQGNRPAADVSPYPAGEMETVVTYQGIESVTASSTAASPFGQPNLGPQYRPFAALVGDPGSSWLSSAVDPEPTLTVRFGRDVPAEVSMNLSQQTVGRAEVDRVELVTDAGTASARPGTSTSVLLKVAGVTRSMRIVLHRAGPATTPIGLALVSIPGVEPREVYEQVAPGDEISLRVSPGGRRACVDPGGQWLCAKELADPGEELQPLDRRVTLRGPLRSTPNVAVVPVQGRRLNAHLDRSMGVSVAGSSQLLDDASARPGAALDQDGATAWIVASTDNRPTLTVTFPQPRTITAASAFVDDAQSIGVRSMVISSGRSTRTVRFGRAPDRMSPLTGTTFRIAFPRAGTDSKFFKSPMAIRSVNLAGSGITGIGSAPMRLPCGQAGTVILDGRQIPLAAELTPGQALAGGAVPGQPCGGEVSLPAGTRHIRVEPGSAMVAESVQLLRAKPSDLADSARPVEVTGQSEEHAVYQVTAGPDGILVVPQSYNIGWRARVGDQVLAPVMVAGWQQGWVLPASPAAVTVSSDFVAQSTHIGGLLVGGLALLLVIALAALPGGRRTGHLIEPQMVQPTARRWLSAVVIAAVAGAVLAGLPGALLAVAGTAVQWRWRPSAVIAFALMAAAGVVSAAAGVSFGDETAAALLQWLIMPILGVLLGVAVGLGRGRADELQSGSLDEPPGEF